MQGELELPPLKRSDSESGKGRSVADACCTSVARNPGDTLAGGRGIPLAAFAAVVFASQPIGADVASKDRTKKPGDNVNDAINLLSLTFPNY